MAAERSAKHGSAKLTLRERTQDDRCRVPRAHVDPEDADAPENCASMMANTKLREARVGV